MDIPIYRGEPLFTKRHGAWWAPFPDKPEAYRRSYFANQFDIRSGNPGKIIKAKTNLDDFKQAMRGVIVQHHTNLNKGQSVVGNYGRPYLKMSIADAFKQLDKDVEDIRSGKTTIEKLAKDNVLFKEGYFLGKEYDKLKPKLALKETVKPLIGPLAKEAGKAAAKVAGPAGVAYTVLDFFKGSPANEGEEEALRAMKNKVYNKSFRGPLSEN